MSKRSSDMFESMDTHEWAPAKKSKVVKATSLGKVGAKDVKATPAFRSAVKKVMAAQDEKKQKDSWLQNVPFGAAGSCAIIPLTPNAVTMTIVQGSAVDQRIGNKIRIKKATFRGTLSPASYNVTNNPVPQPTICKMYFLTYKTAPTTSPNPGGVAFFREGSATSVMDGDTNDPHKEIDTENWTVHGTRTFVVGPAGTQDPSLGQSLAYSSVANNDAKSCVLFNIDITKYIPKKIVWNDAATTPTSKLVYCVIEATQYWAAGVYQATNTISGAIHLSYTDA